MIQEKWTLETSRGFREIFCSNAYHEKPRDVCKFLSPTEKGEASLSKKWESQGRVNWDNDTRIMAKMQVFSHEEEQWLLQGYLQGK